MSDAVTIPHLASDFLHVLTAFRSSIGHGDQSLAALESKLSERMRTLEKDCRSHQKSALFPAAQKLLIYTADDIIMTSGHPVALAWQPWQQREYLNENSDGDERFFELFGANALPAFREPEIEELAFLCIAAGFRGKLRVVPGERNRVSLWSSGSTAELRKFLETLRHSAAPTNPSRLFPGAYDHTDPRPLPLLPLARMTRLVALCFVLGLVSWFAARALIPGAIREAIAAAKEISEAHSGRWAAQDSGAAGVKPK